MLGRLEMDADQCIALYFDIVKEFSSDESSPAPLATFTIGGQVQWHFSSEKLESIIEQAGLSGSDPLNDGTERKCRT
jgi:hypothetical protein